MIAATVVPRDVPIILDGLGTVRALHTAVIRNQVTGVLQSVDFVEGQEVQRGDLLGQIDPRPYQAQLERANAQLARDRGRLANLQVNLDRNVPLLEDEVAAMQRLHNLGWGTQRIADRFDVGGDRPGRAEPPTHSPR